MAYATIDDVKRLIAPFAITTTSIPADAQVTSIIDDTSDEIDVALAGAGYTAPATTPAYFVDWLGLVNSYGAAAAVLRSAFPARESASSGEISQSTGATFWENRYQKALKEIRKGSLPPDIPNNAAFVAPATYFTRNPDVEEEIGVIAEPAFTKAKVF